MDIINHPICNHSLGAPSDMQEDCEVLPVYQYKNEFGPWQVSFWRPSDAELAVLNSGGTIALHVRAGDRAHPVVAMGVEEQDSKPRQSYQDRVQPWLVECFGDVVAYDLKERNYRFGEEALELTQACGMTKEEAHQLVEYVFNRPLGEPSQEAGGTMVTLAALCIANNINLHHAAEVELTRVNQPEMIEKIRRKNASKPKFGPLPGISDPISYIDLGLSKGDENA